MIYLSGSIKSEILGRQDVGIMLTPRMGQRPDLSSTYWGADTGCFRQPESHSDDAYLQWLSTLWAYFPRCLFATGPDRVGDASLTLDLSRPVLPRIRRLGVPAALVAQHGLEALKIPWTEFDCLFIGGWDHWKDRDEPYRLIREAKRQGKHVHMGRVNSWIKLHRAAEAGCDSADGTFLAFAPDHNLERMFRWLRRLNLEPSLLKGSFS